MMIEMRTVMIRLQNILLGLENFNNGFVIMISDLQIER